MSVIPHIGARGADDVVRGRGSSFFPAFRLLSKDRRRDLTVAYAFFRAADDCVDELDNPAAQRAALHYWRDAMRSAFAGEPAHPLACELAEVARRRGIPREWFESLVEGCEWDIAGLRYATEKDLKEYCYRVAGVVGLVCLRIFGGGDGLRRAAVELGIAFQLTNILRDVAEDLARGRVYLPGEWLTDAGLSADSLGDHPAPQGFAAVAERLYRAASELYETALPEFSRIGGKGVAPRAMAAVYRGLLTKIRREGFPVLSRRVRLTPWEKFLALAPVFLRAW